MKPHEIKRDSPQNIRKIAEHHLIHNLPMLNKEYSEEERKAHLDLAETVGFQKYQEMKQRLMEKGESEEWAEHQAWTIVSPMYITQDPAAFQDDEDSEECGYG